MTLFFLFDISHFVENHEAREKNIMGYEPIGKLIMKISLPIMVSMLVQALYNVVDSIFVSWVSEDALTAVTLAFPLQNLMIAFAIGTAVGVNSLLSRRLGEERYEDAEKAGANGLFLSFCTWILFVVIGLFFARPFLGMFTEDPYLLESSVLYTRICLVLSFGVFFEITAERIMQATGDSFHPMITQGVGAIANIILDPVFIFTFNMGVAGAAIATVIGQVMAMILALYFMKKNKYIKVSMKGFKPDGKSIRDIYEVGVPTIITNSIGTVMVSALNGILIRFSTTAVSVFGVYFKLQSFVFMPVFGLSAGLVPIEGFNYGARNRHRITEAVRKGAIIALVIMGVGFLVFQLFPDFLLGLFNASEEMLRYGRPALRRISICFIPAAIAIALGSTFQAVGKGIYTMIISISRQLAALVPAAYILSSIIGTVDGVWLAFPVAEVVGLSLSIFFYLRVYRKMIKPLGKKSNTLS